MIELKRVLTLLSSGPEQQTNYLEELGVAPMVDELGLEFDDVKSREFPPEMRDIINTLDQKLDEMSGSEKSDLWMIGALSSSKEWKDVRQLATKALTLLESFL